MATKKISELSTYTESSISDATQALVPLDDLTVVGTGKTKHMSFAEQAKWFGANLPKLVVNPGVALTASAPFTLSQNWNNNAVTFEGVKIVIDDTASAAGSLPFQVLGGAAGATQLLKLNKSGVMELANENVELSTAAGPGEIGGYGLVVENKAGQYSFLRLQGTDHYTWIMPSGVATGMRTSNIMMTIDDAELTWTNANGTTVYGTIAGIASNHLGLRRGTNAQNLSVFNSYTSPSVYQRGRFGWAAGVLQIGTEHIGVSNAPLSLITNGTERMRFGASGTGISLVDNEYFETTGSPNNYFQIGTTNYGFASIGNIRFNIDSDNNSTANFFIFGKDSGSFSGSATELMRLDETGLLSLGNPSIGLKDRGSAWGFYVGGLNSVDFSISGINVRHASRIGWAQSDDAGQTIDTGFYREAANHIGIRNGTAAQAFSVYGSYTSGSVYNRLRLYNDAGTNYIATEHVGSTAKGLSFMTNGVVRMSIDASANEIYLNDPGIIKTTGSAEAFLRLASGNTVLATIGSVNILIDTDNNASFQSFTIGHNSASTGGDTPLFSVCENGLVALGDPVDAAVPALKKSSTTMQVRLGDDSAFTKLQAQLQTHANAVAESITPTHTLTLYDAAGTAYKVAVQAA